MARWAGQPNPVCEIKKVEGRSFSFCRCGAPMVVVVLTERSWDVNGLCGGPVREDWLTMHMLNDDEYAHAGQGEDILTKAEVGWA